MEIHWHAISTAIAAGSCLGYVGIFWRFTGLRRLKSEGKTSLARIDALNKARSLAHCNRKWRYSLAYRFQDTAGREIRSRQKIDPVLWETLREGQELRVVFLPEAPSVSSPALSLEQRLHELAYYRGIYLPILLCALVLSLLANVIL